MSVKRRLLGIGGKVGLLILSVLLVLSLVPLTSAAANFYVATNGDDTNDCQSGATPCLTIAAAMNKAVTDPASSHDTVYIAAGTYNENLAINDADFDLMGAGSGLTIIDGGGSDSVVAVGSYRTVAMQDLTMQNGATTLSGGGIVNGFGSSLSITSSIVQNNIAASNGGGIYNYGTLSLDTVEITGNQGYRGGAVSNASSGSVTIANSTLSGNNVTGTGGTAVFNNGGTVVVEKTTISGNSSDSAASDVIHNQGGGSIGMTNVTISSNTVSDKILIAAGGTPISTITVFNSTISNNAGDISVYQDGAMTFQNTIISGNNNGGANCFGFLAGYTTSLGNNLEDGDSCNLSQATDPVNTDPLLQPLGDYGGPTQTHALQTSSPAIDTGDDAACPATDQRGVARPFDGDNDATATCDIGAFEYNVVSLSGVALSGSDTGLTNSLYVFEATSSPVDASQPISYRWVATDQTTITHHGGGNSDSISYAWSSPGVKTITVTAKNGTVLQVDTFDITISYGRQTMAGVVLSGPATGSTGQQYTFAASVSPVDATIPISYSWEIDGQPYVVNGDKQLTDEISYSWNDDGAHTVSVTATNPANSVTSSHLITTSSWFVDQATGDNGNDCLSALSPCLTINGAMNKASKGHTIKIGSGTYYNEHLYLTENLTFIGAGSEQTLIDGSGTARGVVVGAGATVTFKHLAIQNGYAGDYDYGGGMVNYGTVTAENVKVVNSTAIETGGGIFNFGTLVLRDSFLSANHSDAGGAALTNLKTATIENSTISGNTGGVGSDGDVLHNAPGATLTMTNVTVSGNSQGTALSNELGGTVTLLNSTIALNTGGIANAGTLNSSNTIIAGNNTVGDNCLAPLTSQGNNLEDGNSCGFSAPGDLSNTNPLLLPLADNGGGTMTHALKKGSRAIDNGNNTVCPATDQRGMSRPVDGNNDKTETCDMGAVEMAPDEFSSPWILFLPAILGAR